MGTDRPGQGGPGALRRWIHVPLTSYDALDTGLFVCAPPLFGALATSRAEGDTTLSAGIRILAARGLMCAFDIGNAGWYDIDTLEDLHNAESLLAGPDAVPVETAIAS